MTEALLLPDWYVFERDYISSGIPHLFVVQATPSVTVFVDQNSARVGARFELSARRTSDSSIRFAEIHVDNVTQDGKHYFEIWTDARSLFANFFHLVSEIISDVVDEKAEPTVALAAAVSRWEALLIRSAMMSDEAQTGLFGELWLLERLILALGVGALQSWVGPAGEAHDFRFDNVEFEIKTTSGSRRIHTINGLGQLQPSPGCALYLLSLKTANSGSGGRSLPEVVAAIEHLLSTSSTQLAAFRLATSAIGYDATNAHLYPLRRRLREPAVLIPVTDGIPRLTPEVFSKIEARFVPERIDRVIYSVDVDGLGHIDGTREFEAVIPAVQEAPE